MGYICCPSRTSDEQFTERAHTQQVTNFFPICVVNSSQGVEITSNRKAVQLNVKKRCSLLLVPLVGLMHPASLDCSNGLLCWHPSQRQTDSQGGERRKGGFRIRAGGIPRANGLKINGFFHRRWNIYITAKSFCIHLLWSSSYHEPWTFLNSHFESTYYSSVFFKKIKLQKNYQKTWEPIPVSDSTKN